MSNCCLRTTDINSVGFILVCRRRCERWVILTRLCNFAGSAAMVLLINHSSLLFMNFKKVCLVQIAVCFLAFNSYSQSTKVPVDKVFNLAEVQYKAMIAA